MVFEIFKGKISMYFKDRYDAGQKLAQRLLKYKNQNPIVLALPRGGVVVGYEISKALNAPLDVFIARKIGAPHYPELGIGAIAPNGVQILDDRLIQTFNIPEHEIKKVIESEKKEFQRRIKLYRQDLTFPDLSGKTVILVDDGLATGVTAKASILSINKLNPQKLVLAVPVSPPRTADIFRKLVDEFVCLQEPSEFYAVGAYYDDFSQISDEEVLNLLSKAN